MEGNTIKAMNLLSVGSLERYIDYVNSFPMLTLEKEKALANDYIQQENLTAAKEMVMSHLRFVVHIARGYSGYGLPFSDLIQEGNIGLMKAVKKFDPTVGVRLAAFAAYWIKAEIHEFILKNWRIVRVATTKAQRKLFFNLRRHKKTLAAFTTSEVEAIANELNVKTTDVREMEIRLNANEQFLDMQNDDENTSYQLEAANSNTSETYEVENYRQVMMDRLETSLSALDERSQNIIRARWFDTPKKTLHELAKELEVSAERIRQIEKMAFNKIKLDLSTLVTI